MKFATTLLVVATTFSALAATACGDSGTTSGSSGSSNRPADIAKLKGDATAGKAVYTQNCLSCHGSDAKSGSAGENLPGTEISKAYSQIVNGGGGMQSFSNLSDQEIANVWAYVLSVK